MSAKDHIRYDVLAQEAMRGMLQRVMSDVARQGLPGEHHFYITFLTQAPGVKLSPRLTTQYPQKMTIILQHQFWDLLVTDERFEVGLSFGGVPERLVIPFSAIKSFLDPSVQFGLEFNSDEAVEPGVEKDQAAASKALAPTPASPQTDTQPTAEGEAKTGDGAEVVRLDRFRKK